VSRRSGPATRDNSFDRLVERDYLRKWRFPIREYKAVKAGGLTRVGDFHRHHGTRDVPHQRDRVQFAESLTDNDAEFASRAHPFEAMPRELGIKHRYTRPSRGKPQGESHLIPHSSSWPGHAHWCPE
jgi:hypothetical protein